MAELDTTKAPILAPKPQQRTWAHRDFLHKSILFFILVALLPLLPSQAPEPLNRSIISRFWELFRLIFIGIAISYGLFSRRNAVQEVEILPPAAAAKTDSLESYVARLLSVSSVFNNEDFVEADVEDNNTSEGKTAAAQAWSSQYYRGDPVVVLADADGVEQNNKPLFLPVRRLRADSPAEKGLADEMFFDDSKQNAVLPSPIPWRSRSGRMEVKEHTIGNSVCSCSSSSSSVIEASGDGYASRTPSSRSTSTSVVASSSSSTLKVSTSAAPSPKLMAKTGEDPGRKKSYRKSTTLPPPPPPPPPPPFLHHGSFAYSDKRDTARSFKDELQNVSRRAREDDVRVSSFDANNNIRNQVNSSPVGCRSPRTVRPKENGAFSKAGKVGSDTALDRMVNENNSQPHPLLLRSQSDKAPVEKTVITSDDDEEECDRKGTPESKPESTPDDNEVDKRADEFIAKFREQIRLQRIESIKRSATHQRNSKISTNNNFNIS